MVILSCEETKFLLPKLSGSAGVIARQKSIGCRASDTVIVATLDRARESTRYRLASVTSRGV